MIWHGTTLISFSTSAHPCKQSHTQTNTIPRPFVLTLKCTDNKDSPSPLFLTCKHTRKDPVPWCDEHLLSDIIAVFPDISFLNATPHTIELLSVPAIGNLCSDSCTATAVKTSFLWCQSVMTPWDIVACVCTSVNMYCECMKSSYRQMPQNMDIVKITLRERLDLAGCATKRTDLSCQFKRSSSKIITQCLEEQCDCEDWNRAEQQCCSIQVKRVTLGIQASENQSPPPFLYRTMFIRRKRWEYLVLTFVQGINLST